jgi:hypothetical protein
MKRLMSIWLLHSAAACTATCPSTEARAGFGPASAPAENLLICVVQGYILLLGLLAQCKKTLFVCILDAWCAVTMKLIATSTANVIRVQLERCMTALQAASHSC